MGFFMDMFRWFWIYTPSLLASGFQFLASKPPPPKIMRSKFASLGFTVTLILASMISGSLNAQTNSITINNYDFADQVVPPTTYIVSTPGWTISNTLGITVALPFSASGATSPYTTNTPGIIGTNYGVLIQVNSGIGYMLQDTGVQYQSGFTYNLTAALGGGSTGNFYMGFFPSGSYPPLASLNPTNLVSGAFSDNTLSYTPLFNEVGQDIIVGFEATSNVSILEVTNVRLSSVPEPSTYALFGFALLALIMANRRRA